MSPNSSIVPRVRWRLGAALFLALSMAVHARTAPPAGKDFEISDLKLDLIWVGPGVFAMGSQAGEAADKAETPPTRVTLTRGFWLGRTEVTQAQYLAIAGVNPSHFTGEGSSAPVERVSWIEAMAYCDKLTKRERAAGRLPANYVYALPTEAQWEYACRAGTTGQYAGDPEKISWYDLNSGDTTHSAAQRQPNQWGFYDMAGNVLEWCADWYGNYPGGAATDPTGPADGFFRMARGGSWRSKLEVGRSAARSGASPARQDYTLGFRLALCFEIKPSPRESSPGSHH
jgi:formylglycine-generating enzyme required for sulfatase activity